MSILEPRITKVSAYGTPDNFRLRFNIPPCVSCHQHIEGDALCVGTDYFHISCFLKEVRLLWNGCE